jgi:hypothetical protein
MKIKIILCILLLVSFNLSAQVQILYQNTQTKSYLLSYSNSSNDESQQVINEMINAIATYIPKPNYQTKITFSVDEDIKITRDKNIVSIMVTHQKIILSGDVFYKGFDMTDVLVPAKYEFAGKLSRRGGVSLADFTQPKINFTPPYSEIVLQYTDTMPSSAYTFAISTTKFYYDNTSRTRFRDKVTLVDQYYLADADLNNMNIQLNSINPDDFEHLENTQITLNGIQKSIANISGAPFWQALNISNFDPLYLSRKLNDVSNRSHELQNKVNYTQSMLYQLYYNKGVDQYNNNKLNDARQSFERSLSNNAGFAPSKFYLAQIAYDQKNTDEAKQQLKQLFAFNNIDNNTRAAAMGLAHALEWVDMNIAAGLLTMGKYDESLIAVNKAEVFCKSIPNYKCNDTIELIRKDCHNGIYQEQWKTADNLFTQKKLEDAETEIDMAINYQRQHFQYIPDNQAALDIKQKIKMEQYYTDVKKGREQMDAKVYRSAFNYFNKATEIEPLYPVKKDKQLPELLKKAKLEVMFLDLDDAEKKVQANDLVNARSILQQVITEQKFYGLLDNAKLLQRIENLKKSIFSQECINAQKEYDGKISAASAAISNKKFIDAENSYKEALTVIDNNRDCGINGDLAYSGKKNVEKPAEYQRQYAQCDDFARNIRYNDAIAAYNKLTVFYNSNSIESSGIIHQPLQLFILNYESNFVLQGVTYFTNAGDLENAFYLLKQLRQRNMSKSLTKLQQIGLARAMAIRDYKANPGMNAKLKVAEYTISDKWYGYFSKEYIKQVKKIQ